MILNKLKHITLKLVGSSSCPQTVGHTRLISPSRRNFFRLFFTISVQLFTVAGDCRVQAHVDGRVFENGSKVDEDSVALVKVNPLVLSFPFSDLREKFFQGNPPERRKFLFLKMTIANLCNGRFLPFFPTRAFTGTAVVFKKEAQNHVFPELKLLRRLLPTSVN